MNDMNIKKKGRKRLNVIDVVIILLLVALVGTAGYRIYTEVTKGGSSAQSNIVVTFEAQVEDEGIIEYLKNGDAVYFTTDKAQLGVLYDTVSGDDNGPVYVFKATEDGKITVIGTLKLVADAHKAKSGNYYVIGERNINVGSKLDVYTDMATLEITIKSIGVPAS